MKCLEAELDRRAMEYGELWDKIKRKKHKVRLDLIDKEIALLDVAQKLYSSRQKHR